MIKRFRSLYIFSVIILFTSACGPWAVPTQAEEQMAPKTPIYESILDRALTDDTVAEFLSSNDCSRANQFLLCQSAGVALWVNSNQVVETVYLYLNKAYEFEPYQGELPFGLKFYDSLGAVEYKLKRRGVGNAGLPDEAATPDHLYYHAIYHQAGLTIVYNAPFPDEDATIYAIIMD
jgi:hypothetical protein